MSGARSSGTAAAAAVLTALLASSAGAAEVSLQEARRWAERRSPDIAVAGQTVEVSRADVDVAGALANPTLTVQTAKDTAKLGTALSVPLPLFGQRSTAIDAARADLAKTELDLTVTRREARWNATLAWIDLWEAEQHRDLTALAAEEARHLEQIAKERFEAGLAPELDVLRSRADRARAQAETAATQALALASSARLVPWIGAGEGEELHAKGAPSFASPLPPLPALEDALAHHPSVERDRAAQTAAEAHLRAEQRARWPVINAELAVNQFDPTQPGTDVIGGVSFEVPILNLRGGAIAHAEAQERMAEATLEAGTRRLLAQLRDAYRRAEGAGARLTALEGEVLPAMNEARKMTEAGYTDGRIDLARLLEAQHALLETRIAHATAIAEQARAIADLERAAGTSFEEQGTDAR